MLHHRIRKAPATILAAALLLPAAGGAQETVENEQAAEQQNQTQELVQKYRQTVQKLQQIRDEAVTANPELEEQSRAFDKQVQQAMDESDYDVDAGRKKLQEMGSRFQKEDLSEEKRRELAAAFQAERRQMEQARQQVMQQEDIRAAGRQLQEDILTAMKEQDPETEVLLERLRKLRQQLQAIESGEANQEG